MTLGTGIAIAGIWLSVALLGKSADRDSKVELYVFAVAATLVVAVN